MYKKVNKLASDFGSAYFNQAMMYFFSNAHKALCYLNETLKLNPQFATAYFFRGYLNMQGDKDMKRILNDWNKAIDIDSTNSFYRLSRGFLYLSKNKYNEGIYDLNFVVTHSKQKRYISDFAKSFDIQHRNDFFSQLFTVNEFALNFSI